MSNSVTPEMLRRLGEIDTCTVANAIESFDVRLRNEGFSNSTLACHTPAMPAMVGRAVTLRVRSSEPSMKNAFYMDRPDWWERVEVQPGGYPLVLVIEDIDNHPGRGALVGPVHACILKALGCVGVVTNGAVRGLERFEKIGLQAFSGDVSPSHAYGHVVEAGVPVTVAGMRIAPGDVLHGDRHGIVAIPAGLVEGLPEVARRFREREMGMCQFCASVGFSTSALRRLIESGSGRT
jgi:4-hydroxy-4-methyl-2-oxoglutarate aldolase